MTTIDPHSPMADEVLQDELSDIPAAPVRHIGPIDTRELPAIGWGSGQVTLNIADGPRKLVQRNPNRKRLVIACSNNSLYIGESQGKVVNQGSNGFRMSNLSNGQAELFHTDEVWGATSVDGNLVSWFEEYWT